jgi:hypothetical protein
VGGSKPQYIGTWDSSLGRMTWQDVGDGLHEVHLDWDPTSTSYFPKIKPKLSTNLLTRPLSNPVTTLSPSEKKEKSRRVQPLLHEFSGNNPLQPVFSSTQSV